jgi:hypothetical protein
VYVTSTLLRRARNNTSFKDSKFRVQRCITCRSGDISSLGKLESSFAVNSSGRGGHNLTCFQLLVSWSRSAFKRPLLPLFPIYPSYLLPAALGTILLSTTHICNMLLLRKTLHDLIITSSIQPILLSAHDIHSQRIRTAFSLGLQTEWHECVFNAAYNYHPQIWGRFNYLNQ